MLTGKQEKFAQAWTEAQKKTLERLMLEAPMSLWQEWAGLEPESLFLMEDGSFRLEYAHEC